MRRRSLTWIAVVATIAGAVFIASAVAQDSHVVRALDPNGDPPAENWIWDPGVQDGSEGTIEVEPEDTVTWEFNQAGDPHDLWLQPPGDAEPIQLSLGCSDGPGQNPNWCYPDSEPIEYTFDEGVEEGEYYVYYCTLHGGTPEGTSGMAGRIGDAGEGPERIPNETESPGPPWEAGTEPPRMTGVQARRANPGARLKLRLSHPGRVNVRLRGNGGVKLNRTIRNLPAGVSQRKLNNGRLTSGRYRVIVRGWDRWGQQTKPRVVRRWVRLRY